MVDDVPAYRNSIVGLLRLLSSEDEQRDYEKRVPIANIADELVCQWFDDMYHPDDEYWRAMFSTVELKSMEQFSEMFQETIRWPSPASIEEWLANARWRELMNAAATTMATFKQKGTPIC